MVEDEQITNRPWEHAGGSYDEVGKIILNNLEQYLDSLPIKNLLNT